MRFGNFSVWGVSALLACVMSVATSQAQPYYYVGADGGDFFDENNWNSVFDSTAAGTSLFAVGDVLQDLHGAGAESIYLDLIIDPSSTLNNGVVVADGWVQFSDFNTPAVAGSLVMKDGASLTVNDNSSTDDGFLHFFDDSSFEGTNATVVVADDIDFSGASATISGGTITSTGDDVEFGDAVLDISGAAFQADDYVLFDGDPITGTVTGSTFNMDDDFSVAEAGSTLTLTDTTITVGVGGDQDINDSSGGDGGTLVLLGASTLLADDVRENSAVVLGGTTSATLGLGSVNDTITDGSTATLDSMGASLSIADTDEDLRGRVFNGLTGLSYADDNPANWTVTDWDGFGTPAALQIVGTAPPIPEPSSLMLSVAFGCCFVCRRTRVSPRS